MNLIKDNNSVTEILGTLLLLIIAVIVMSFIVFTVLTNINSDDAINVDILARLDNGFIVLEHQGGENIDLNSDMIVRFGDYGALERPFYLDQGLIINGFKDDGWGIGETLLFDISDTLSYDEDDRTAEVKITITDFETNDLIMYGTLRDGYTIPYFMGGIWHFNETIWNETLDEVEDSSGNDNHGTSNNAYTTSENVNGVTNRSGFFNGFESSYVFVPNSYSLGFFKNITIEAWIRPEIEPLKIEETELGPVFAYYPNIIKLNGSDDNYAVVSGRYQTVQNGILQTVNIMENGSVNVIDGASDYIFESSKGYMPKIININDTIYAIVYFDGPDRGIIKTIEIFPNGQINTSIISSDIFELTECFDPEIIHINGNVYAIVYSGSNKGILKTIEILPNGDITPLELDNFQFDLVDCSNPDIINVNGNVYAIAYSGFNNGSLVTVIILPSGVITPSIISSFEFETNNCYTPEIIYVNGIVYAISYSDSTHAGRVKTLEISVNGLISEIVQSAYSEIEFSNSNVYLPKIIKVQYDEYGVVWATGDSGGPEGLLSTFKINPDGYMSEDTIIPLINVTDPIGPGKFFEPDIIQVSDRIFAVVYRSGGGGGVGGQPHEGYVSTLRLIDDTTPLDQRGIVKGGALSLYADAKQKIVYASINNGEKHLTLPITPSYWHHVVLTYDNSKLVLYCNVKNLTDTTFNTNYPNYNETNYNKEINNNPGNDLYFGRRFYGYLDEIAIFDTAYNQTIIKEHYDYPGIF
ncbi:LamG-like jellyroll fold domain-containing protein [Thermoplasmatota archaeon]